LIPGVPAVAKRGRHMVCDWCYGQAALQFPWDGSISPDRLDDTELAMRRITGLVPIMMLR
jgi:hypothetical protein